MPSKYQKKHPDKNLGRRKNVRPNTMKSAEKERFLNFLASNGGLKWSAARKARVPFKKIQGWYLHDPEFAKEVEETIKAAKERTKEKLIAVALERAVKGRTRPIFGYNKAEGKAVKSGEEKIPSDSLLMFALKQLDPSFRDNPRIDIKNQVNVEQQVTHKIDLSDEESELLHRMLERMPDEGRGYGSRALPQPQKVIDAIAEPVPAAEPIAVQQVDPIPENKLAGKLAAIEPEQLVLSESKPIEKLPDEKENEEQENMVFCFVCQGKFHSIEALNVHALNHERNWRNM